MGDSGIGRPRLSLGGLSLPMPRMPVNLLSRDPAKDNGHHLRVSAQITGWGKYLPAKVLTNADLERMVDTSDEWIRTRSGIVERHIVGPKEHTSVMAVRAAQNALAVADLSPNKLDAVIVTTATPDQPVPSTASIVQDAIGASKAAAFDVNAGCTGFIYGLVIANGLIAAGTHRNVLVIGADTLSRFTDWSDRSTCVLFGDGAGAVLLQPGDAGTGVLSVTLGSDGFGRDLLTVPAGGSRLPASRETVEKHQHYIQMNGREIFKFAVNKVVKATSQVVAEAGLRLEDVALVIPHQANLRIIQAAARGLKMPEDKFFVNIDHCGNTSSASIPMALTDAVEGGRLKQGDYLVLVGFGAGLTWGAAVVLWGAAPVVAEHPAWKSLLLHAGTPRRRIRALLRLTRRKIDVTRWWHQV